MAAAESTHRAHVTEGSDGPLRIFRRLRRIPRNGRSSRAECVRRCVKTAGNGVQVSKVRSATSHSDSLYERVRQRLGVDDRQAPGRPRQRDVERAQALGGFGHDPRRFGHDHRVELEPLGEIDRHQRDGAP